MKQNTALRNKSLNLLTYDKKPRTFSGERIPFLINGVEKLDNHMPKNEIGHLSFPTQKINSKLIKDLNITPETIKLLEENIRKKLLEIGFGCYILRYDTKSKVATAKTNQWGHIKL